MLWGIDPVTYPQGSLTEQRKTAFQGMHGFYNRKQGLFLPASYVDVLACVSIGRCVGLQFGDGDYSGTGVVGILPRELDDIALQDNNDCAGTLKKHIGYQNRLPGNATLDAVLRMQNVEEMLNMAADLALENAGIELH